MAQAERDLEQARASQRDGPHEWACFASYQSAEKALKALHLHRSQEAWGHFRVYTEAEWRAMRREGGRFVRTLESETVWI